MKFNAKKFLSRKFIVTLLTDILGVALLLSDLGGKLGAIMGIVAIVLTSIIYIISEASVDRKGITLTNITEEVLKDIEEIKMVDILAEGEFVEKLKDNNIPWVGSSNQRVIDVQKTFKAKQIILHT